MSTIEELIPVYEKYYDTLVLMDGPDFFPIMLLKEIRLEDCGDFGGEDYFYIAIDFKGEEHHMSCVGRMIPLIDKLNKEDYEALTHRWNFNFKLRYQETIAKNEIFKRENK